MLSAGQRLGPYEVLAPLGAGGMGEVWRARDTRLGRFVAIKTLPAAMAADAEAVARFEREAKALAALAHPNIVAIHEFDTVDGVSFAVMELLEGETGAERLARGPVPWREAVDIAIAAASGIAAAHGKGIIHRDLKPANIFLTADGHVKVLDFGIARADWSNSTAHNETTQPLQTNPGTVVGTLGYVAPEVLRGKPADAQSDIFALGCVLFEMVSGERAFLRDTPVATLAAILTDPPTPTPLPIPPPVAAIVDRCLDKSPARRFGTMKELIAALRMLQTTREIETPRRRGPRRHMEIAAVLALIALAIFLATRRRSAPPSAAEVGGGSTGIRRIAVLPFENDDPELDYLSDGVTEALINRLSRMGDVRVVARTTVFRYKGSKLDPRKIAQQLDADTLVVGKITARQQQLIVQSDLLDVRSGSQLWGERYEVAGNEVMRLQEALARDVTRKLGGAAEGSGPPRQTVDAEAYRLYLKGRFYWNKRTEEGFAKAIEHFDQAVERDPQFALAYSGLADCYVLSYALPEPETMRRAKDAARQALTIDETLAEPHTSLAQVLHYFDWDWPEAEREFRRAIELNPNYALAHHWYGRHLVQTGRVEEGLAELRRALELDPLSLIVNADYGYFLFIARRYNAAVEQLRKTFELDPSFVRPHLYAAWTLHGKGDYEGAMREVQKTIELGGRTSEALSALGAIEFARGNRAASDAARDELVARSKRAYVAPLFMMQLYLARGEIDEASAWFRKAAAENERSSLLDIAVEPVTDRWKGDPRIAPYLPGKGDNRPSGT